MSDGPLTRTGSVIREGIDAGHHLGAQVAVWPEKATTPTLVSLGDASLGVPMTHNHLLPWLSATKAVAAIAIAQLWELGRVGLDEQVIAYLPEFESYGKDVITLRHLLTHTGGFRAAPYDYPRDDWDTILQTIYDARLEPDWVPGHKAGYHITTSWFVLGEIIQRLSGQSFPEYVRSHIFEPLGMTDCHIGMSDTDYDSLTPRIAVVPDTARKDRSLRPWTTRPFLTGCSPASNGIGPARELVRLYKALVTGGALDNQRILDPEAIELFTARHRVNLYDHTFKATMDWGLGFILDSKDYGKEIVPYGYGPHASHYTFGHSGNQASAAFADAAHNLAVAILWNGTPGEPAHQDRVHRTLGALYEDLDLA
ncbi:MAG: serine hydrolase domain-containing protein [Phycisphaeraceae bacterium]